MENLTQLLEDFKAETKQPAIRLTTRQSDQITATNSKFGGLPYLPKNFAYPMDGKGNPLKLLAQLNFGELPPLADFPSEGILQFFVLNNKMLGVKDWKNQSKVLYHEKILPESEQMTDFPEVKYISEDDEELEFPFEGEFLITGELVEMSMPYDYGDGGFFDNFKPFCEKHGIMSHFEKIFLTGEDWKNLSESEEEETAIIEFLAEFFEYEECHIIGGFPEIVQNDPREFYDKVYDTLLFQMSSDYAPFYFADGTQNEEKSHEDDIMWGDAGVAHFFINRTDLQNLKFDDVLYNWDCS